MYPPSLLDTDILSELFKGNNLVKSKASEYIREHGRLTISHIAKYEIMKNPAASYRELQVKIFLQQ